MQIDCQAMFVYDMYEYVPLEQCYWLH